MTEESKQKFLQMLANSNTQINQVVLGDGYQQNVFGNVINQGSSEANSESEETQSTEDVLSPDEEIVDESSDDSNESSTQSYPPVTHAQYDFIVGTYALGEKGNRQYIAMPVERLFHLIYDITKEWNITDRNNTIKWRLLYECLDTKGYFEKENMKRWKDFTAAVVAYCFPEVDIDGYRNKLSHIKIPEYMNQWRTAEAKLFTILNDQLSIENLTSSK